MQGFYAEVAEGDGAVVALEHDWAGRSFVVEAGAAGGAGDFDVFVDEFSVLPDFDEAAVFGFFAGGVEARSAEDDVKGLPFARTTAGVDARGVAVIAFVGFPVPALVDAATVAVFEMVVWFAPAVEDLDFVTALHVDAGVGVGGDVEFDVDGRIAMCGVAEEVVVFASGAVDENSGAGMDEEEVWIFGIQRHGFGDGPTGRFGAGVPLGEVLAVEEIDGVG